MRPTRIEDQRPRLDSATVRGLSNMPRFFLVMQAALWVSVLMLAGCAQADSQAVSVAEGAQVVIAVTPETFAAELEPTDTLSEAADQLAALLGVNRGNILVRIQSRDCSVCKIDAGAVEFPDLPVDDAQARLESSDKFWLVVQDLTCYYYYDGKTVSPLACNQEKSTD